MSEDAEKEHGLGGYFINLNNPWTIIATVITLVAAITAPLTIALTSYIGAACKILIDSERRKNTQASNDVRARQLVRF